jgi:hypothetical protein
VPPGANGGRGTQYCPGTMPTGTNVGAPAVAGKDIDETAAGESPLVADRAPDRDGVAARRMAVVATVAAMAPVLVAGIRGALRGWTPTGDDAYSAIRAWDLFSSNPPLLGTWSSASFYTGHEINHPGPLQFDLLAVPVRLLGHGPGTAIGLAAVNAIAIALIGWLVARRAGPAAAALAMAASALLSWSMGSEMLYDPWSQHAPLIPFSLFLVAVWCAVAGDRAALPIMVVAGSYAFQTHLSYTILVPGLVAFALAAVAIRTWQERQGDPEAWRRGERRSALRWAAITGATLVVCWAQPIYEQLTSEGEGNLLGLLRSSRAEAPTPGLVRTLRAYGGTVAVPPMWLPPSFGSPSFDIDGTGRPTWLAASALVALAVALAVLGWRARSRGSSVVAAGAVTALAVLALGFVTTIRMPIRLGMVPTYARFMWPLGMMVWLTLGVALLDEARSRWSSKLRQLAAPGLVLALVAGVATLPTVDNQTATFPWTLDAIDAVDDDVVAAVEGEGPLLVEFHNHLAVGGIGPAVLVVLQDAGIPFYVNDVHLVSQLGTPRRFEPGDAEMRLVVKGGIQAEAEPGEELVASWSPLSDAEEAEVAALSAELRDVVAEHGVPLVEDGPAALEMLEQDHIQSAIRDARSHPEDVVTVGILWELWRGIPALFIGRPLLDGSVFPTDLMERWADLTDRRERLPIRIYLAPVA